jgi:hypothetical protein
MDIQHLAACEFLAAVIRNQPELLKGFTPNKDSGEMVANFCSGFIERFARSLKEFDAGSSEASLDDWSFLNIKKGA